MKSTDKAAPVETTTNAAETKTADVSTTPAVKATASTTTEHSTTQTAATTDEKGNKAVETKEKITDKVACPYCKPATYWSKKGIKSHVRNQHPEEYVQYSGREQEEGEEPKPDQNKVLILAGLVMAGLVILALVVFLSSRRQDNLQLPPAPPSALPDTNMYLGGN